MLPSSSMPEEGDEMDTGGSFPMLSISSMPEKDYEQQDFLLGLALFTITSFINVWYMYLEFRELASKGVSYFCQVQNVFDLLSICNILVLAPLILTGHPYAHLLGSLGTMLMIPKMAAMVRPTRRHRLCLCVIALRLCLHVRCCS